ncbi:MAG: L,D-transpeptidase family protein [Steroidobacteraceae bacterium]
MINLRKLFAVALLLLGWHAQAAVYTLPAAHDTLIGQVLYVTTRDEDTLFALGRQYGVGYEEMVAANPGVDPWVPGAGRRILIPTQYLLPDAPRVGIVVNVSEHRIYYYPKAKPGEASVVYTFPVSIGKMDWKTPLGQTFIADKRMNPTWYPPASVRKEHAARGDYLPAAIPPGKDNPLGEFAMRLGIRGGSYLIHGTNKPIAVGMDVTHGCIRMFPEDIENFFKQVPIGTPVLIMDQPYKMGWSEGHLYMEVHKPLELGEAQWDRDPTDLTRMFVGATRQHPARMDWQDAEQVFRSNLGVPSAVKLLQPALMTDMRREGEHPDARSE